MFRWLHLNSEAVHVLTVPSCSCRPLNSSRLLHRKRRLQVSLIGKGWPPVRKISKVAACKGVYKDGDVLPPETSQ